jgi:hypothetical protein
MNYHIVSRFQNRGIGQLVLAFVVRIFFRENRDRILMCPTNERRASIAQKTGFVKKRVEFTNLSCLIINNGKI